MSGNRNPATGEPLDQHAPHSATEIERRLAAAERAFLSWRETSLEERGAHVRRVAEYLRRHKERLARVASLEMGKPITEALAEVEKCATNCDFYAEHAAQFLGDERVASNASDSYVAFRPLGVVLAIMPWNFPYWQVFRFAAPALMAGNTAVLKHAANVSGCALEIERVFREAGLPEGTFATLLVAGKDTRAVIEDRRIAAVTLTGSDEAGAAVAAAAGAVLKKCVLELGGSDAFVVLADADIEAAAKIGVKARFQNAGQSCICAKRFIIEASVYDAFVDSFVAHTRELVIGDPLEAATQYGPLARADLRDTLERQVREALAGGARLVLGGTRLERPGFYFAPTVLGDVTPAMTSVFREETFGPVAVMVRAEDADAAIALANDSPFGLGGNLWTRDLTRARHLAARFESGAVFINGMTASDSRLPFGGVKRSGYGRELSSFGIREFVNIQTVWIGPDRAASAASAQGSPAE